MVKFSTTAKLGSVLACLCLVASGCSGKSTETDAAGKTTKSTTPGDSDAGKASNEPEVPTPARKPIQFEPPPGKKEVKVESGGTYSSVQEALKPLQVVVGAWRGVTSGTINNVRGVETPVWSWDFSKKGQPALAFAMDDCTYLRKGRLTYLLDLRKYELTAQDRSGKARVYRGNFTEPVLDKPIAGKIQRTFKLTLEQIKPALGVRDAIAKVEFVQQENNRYHLIIHRKAGKNITKADTIGNQRKGTSFAASLDDYGDKTCVVTQGLGTMTVSHKGKTYYVCCSGCKKTFEDDPEMWIASFEEWKRKNNK